MTRQRLKAAYREMAQKAADARRARPDYPGQLDEEIALLVEERRLTEGGVSPRGWAEDIGELMSDIEKGVDGFVGK